MNLPHFSVKNPVTTLMLFLAAIVIGGVCFFQMPVDLLPKMDLPAISVLTTYEGAAPEDIENKVTEVLERFLSSVPELKHITSVSKENLSVITLSFEWGTDLDTRSNEIRDLVGMSRTYLPDDVDDPRVFKFDLSRFPIMFFAVKARESYPRLEKILEDEISDPLKRLPGVAAVSLRVPLLRQVNVEVDRERLAAYGLTFQDVTRAISRENRDTPAGDVKMGMTDYLVRVPGEYKDVTAMGDIVLASRNGAVVRLSDIASVEDSFKELTRHITINGERGALIMVQKESEANTVTVARAVHKRMAELKKRLPPDVEIMSVMDSSEDIELLLRDLSQTLLIGGLLTMGVVLLFLRQWRATLVIGLAIPFSLILAIIINYFLGYTINMMTLFGLIIAVGMVVDNAIVVLDTITRHRETGERADEGSIYGTSEVAMAITASTLTTVCIFFPILFVQGITRIMFTEFSVVVTVTLVASLFSALTLTPMLSSTIMRTFRLDHAGVKGSLERAYTAMSDGYSRLLGWSLGHRRRVVIISALIFGSSLLLVPRLGSEFMPEEDKSMINGTVHLAVGTRVEETARVMGELNRIINETVAPEERKAVFMRCGTSEEGTSSIMGEEAAHIGGFGIKLAPRSERSRSVKKIAELLRGKIDSVKSSLNIEKYILDTGDPMAGLLTGGEKPLTINIIGNDMELTDRIAVRIRDMVMNTPGTVDVSISREKGRPEVWVNVDRQKASNLGLNVSDIGDTVRAAFYGTKASRYRVHGDEYDIFVRLREPDRDEVTDIEALSVRLPSSRLMRVGNVADVSFEYSPVEIERKDQGRIVNVTGNVQNRSLGEVVADIEAEIKKMEIPQGVEIFLAGQTEEQRTAFFWLSLALAIGIVLVYMVMASQFESLIDPFVVMFSVPFAFTGAIWAIFLGGHHVSIVIFIGLLLLVGVVVNNAIVLVDYINILRARGFVLLDAVQRAGKTRLRPVLMTAITTIVALIPMAFGKGQGSEIWNPLGLTIFGGMIVSTLVTLILAPTIYSIFESRTRKFRARQKEIIP